MRKLLNSLPFILLLSFCRADQDSPGTIAGFVKFHGEAPPRNMFAVASDHDCPHAIAQTHLLVKQDTLGLQNVLVVLDREDRRVMPTRLQSTLSMDGCQILPRVQWLPLGASLLLINKDGARHHLHAWKGGNTLFEADVNPNGPPARRPLVIPGLYKINCDRHLWERAWIYVSAHDSVALTDAQGGFTIKHVPPGRYRIHAWHEGWVKQPNDRDGRLEFLPMQQTQDVRVQENQESQVDFKDLSPASSVSSPD